ncbi:MAG: DUF4406 domain-containing protein [Bacteroidota bacterium]
MKKVYIIGAVSGLPAEEVQAKFAKAAESLKSMGMVPVNPVEFVPEDLEWKEAMKLCIRALIDCDMVLLLPDWQYSKGGTLEVSIARNLDISELRHSLKMSGV